jgi:uroporphyrinogen decarboxylase
MADPTARELFNAVMHYEDFDRMPVMHWTQWPETLERWHEEGLPEDMTPHEYFGVPHTGYGVGVNVSLYPAFKEEIIEETDEYWIKKGGDGVIMQDWKHKSCIPHFIGYTLKGAEQWDEYKKRLQPDPGRIPSDFEERIKKAETTEEPVTITTASTVGWIRNWMGVTNLAYLAYDDRDLLKEMIDTIADLVIWGLEQVLPKVKVDAGWGWEDICFRSGPLVSPEVFKEVSVPAYRKIADKLLEYGVDLYVVDCDGLIDHLVPLWLEGGVNVMFPIEIGAWKADPYEFRKKYGKELLVYGGIDKLVLEKDKAAIDAEIERRIPFMKEGGFVPLPDHLITPGVPLDNYKYYLEKMQSLRF